MAMIPGQFTANDVEILLNGRLSQRKEPPMKIGQIAKTKTLFPKTLNVKIENPFGNQQFFSADEDIEKIITADGEFVGVYQLVEIKKSKLVPQVEE